MLSNLALEAKDDLLDQIFCSILSVTLKPGVKLNQPVATPQLLAAD
jgi:hypothetical protein